MIPQNTPINKEERISLDPFEVAITDTDSSSSVFVETFVFESTNPKEIILGNLYIVGQIYSTRSRKENAEILAEIADVAKDEYYRNAARGPSVSIRLTLKKINSLMEMIKKRFSKSSLKVNFSIGVISKDRLFVARLGEGVTFMVRGSVVTPVESKLVYREGKESSFSEVIEGDIIPGDAIIFSTPQIYKIGRDKIAKLSKNESLTSFILKSEHELKNLGAIIIYTKSVNSSTKSKTLKEEIQESVEVESNIQEIATRPKRAISSRRGFFVRAITLLVVVLVVSTSIFFAIKAQRESAFKKNEGERLISEMQTLERKVNSLVALENYQEAETALIEWEEKLIELSSLKVFEQEVSDIEDRFVKANFKVKQFEELPSKEILSLETNTVNFNPAGIVGNSNNITLFADNILYDFDMSTKRGGFTLLPDRIDNRDVEKILINDIGYEPDESSDRFLLTKESVLRYNNNEITTVLESDNLGDSRAMEMFSGSLYILSHDTILFLNPERPTLNTWLRGSYFDNASDFAIDGFIYVLEDSKVFKFLNGEKNIEIETEKGFERVVTNTSLKNLYLFNPSEGTIAIMNKFGNITRRIASENLKDAKDFIVSENEKTLLFLKDKRVFSINL